MTREVFLGFFVLPGILRTQIVNGIRDGMKREARLDRVRFNPLILSLTLQGFELKDPDGTSFVAFDRMNVDVQFTSIFRWALTLREFRLDRPRVHVRLLPDGKLNFDDLIPAADRQQEARAVHGDHAFRPQVDRFPVIRKTFPLPVEDLPAVILFKNAEQLVRRIL